MVSRVDATTQKLLEEAKQLSLTELDKFVVELLALRA